MSETVWETAIAYAIGDRILIDGVECIITSIGPASITTRPVTDAD